MENNVEIATVQQTAYYYVHASIPVYYLKWVMLKVARGLWAWSWRSKTLALQALYLAECKRTSSRYPLKANATHCVVVRRLRRAPTSARHQIMWKRGDLRRVTIDDPDISGDEREPIARTHDTYIYIFFLIHYKPRIFSPRQFRFRTNVTFKPVRRKRSAYT